MRLFKFCTFLAIFLSSSAEASWTVGLKSFRQIFQSLSVITQVSQMDTEVQALFAAHRERLPREGVLEELTVPSLMSVITVGDVFCRKFIAAEAAMTGGARRAHATIDFTRGPSAFTAAMKEDVLTHYGELFWQRSLTVAEQQSLLDLLNRTISALPSDPDATQKALRPACISMVASLSFLTI